MSNTLAIAAVTATLKNLLAGGVGSTIDLPPNVPASLDLGNAKVTAKPPDKARAPADTSNQLNLFLFHTGVNAAWSNLDTPGRIKPGETAHPPVALTLNYLLTAYGNHDDDVAAHVLLGQAMRALHDHAILGPAEISAALPGNNLHQQIERVRIATRAMSAEEMSKLWTTFQTQYRVSTAYEASVVLIDSAQPARVPLPVLMRGEKDRGAVVAPDPVLPTLEDVAPPNHQSSARLGDVITITGHHLEGKTVVVRFVTPRLAAPIQVAAKTASASSITVVIPDDAKNWPAGFYTVSVLIAKQGDPALHVTNALPLSIAPQITTAPPLTVKPDKNGDVAIKLDCKPEVLPAQAVALLVGDREVPAEPHAKQTTSVTFTMKAAPLGKHFVRLRVDGVDSLLVQFTGDPPAPAFDPEQQLEMAP
jgi:uncharacterized protein DUF4255